MLAPSRRPMAWKKGPEVGDVPVTWRASACGPAPSRRPQESEDVIGQRARPAGSTVIYRIALDEPFVAAMAARFFPITERTSTRWVNSAVGL